MSLSPAPALKYLDKHADHFLSHIQEFLRIPSISSLDQTHQSDIQLAADWVAERLRHLDLQQVEIHPTDGNPIVYGENLQAGETAPTILIYGHYDVQLPDPLEDWTSPPFEPTIRGDSLYARGASDMKGQLVAVLSAIEALTRTGELPVNVKFLIEGEEELGSPHLEQFLRDQHQRLTCDYALNPDAGEMLDPQTPVIVYALRGMVVFRLTILGPKQDIHSGLFGGVVQNPIHALSELVANLQDDHGHITLQDFYTRVRPIDEEERLEFSRLPFGKDYFLKETGVPALWGDDEFTPLERTVARPSMDVLQFEAGQPKSAIPSKATALLSFRLVPYQDPDELHQQLQHYLEINVTPTVRWKLEYLGGAPPAVTSRSSKAVQTMKQALETAFNAQPIFQRLGGNIPAVVAFQQHLNADSVLTGFSLADDNLHGPNEKLHLPTWKKGMEALIHFLCNVERTERE